MLILQFNTGKNKNIKKGLVNIKSYNIYYYIIKWVVKGIKISNEMKLVQHLSSFSFSPISFPPKP